MSECMIVALHLELSRLIVFARACKTLQHGGPVAELLRSAAALLNERPRALLPAFGQSQITGLSIPERKKRRARYRALRLRSLIFEKALLR
jgi:hypothetical protein